jgi:hypothetical protein
MMSAPTQTTKPRGLTAQLSVALFGGAVLALLLTSEEPKIDWCEPPHSMPIDRPECWR